ncbi:M10 family metallopeptidase [Methylobacterium sp. E-045]|uniref:M10 family metallopeptidase n=1 Tax=Methylobacterium sp. E-045 TaxID=2836575 RepID=UPI001FB96A15|nr:M10 family metallopeptidase [Methylobacterium sp. E-045]MCJ2132282.1 M10 family metallopeptidase C-terminal domain-containing protein [Methylobacterium sp. E-045]
MAVPGSAQTSRSDGKTALLFQVRDRDGTFHFSGEDSIDAVLIGSKWTIGTLTYSFPTSGSFYEGSGYEDSKGQHGDPVYHLPFNPQQQEATRYTLDLVAAYTNLTFQEITETATTHADLRFSQTSWRGERGAHANFPSSNLQAGDVWFGTYSHQPFYSVPAIGNWGQATTMHEIGHALGLKHGHQDYTNAPLNAELGLVGSPPRYGTAALPLERDGQDWSLMTYRSDPTNPGPSFEGEGFNQPQTYMQDDIAALQFLYGANFHTNSGNTTYRWDAKTGEMSIDGIGQGAPTANTISMTIWDGNGRDTYDLSNYATALDVDLRPGAFSTFSPAQLVNHQAYSGGDAIAVGNVANALLHQGDLRSLIENAIGGRGHDRIVGNTADNRLDGGLSSDTMFGLTGNDTYLVDDRRDTVVERAGQGTDSVRSSVSYALGENVEHLILIGKAARAVGNDLANALRGNAGDNVLNGGAGHDRLYGNDGADRLSGGLGNDRLDGGAGNDTLSGGWGHDVLIGGRGSNVLTGGRGDDVLFLGAGANRTVFDLHSGDDTLFDFSVSSGDRIDLSGQSYSVGRSSDGDALLTLSGGGTVELDHIRPSQVDSGFFV